MEPHPIVARARDLAGLHEAPRASGDVAPSTSGPWEFLVARDTVASALLGEATADGEPARVARQIEALTTRSGFTHWWDPVLARAWMDRAVELTSDATRARLEAGTYEEQCEGVREAWRALSGVYRALNIPWTVDPYAREAYTSRTMAGDSRQWCDAGTWGRAALTFTPGPYVGTEDGGQGCPRLHNRITLDTASAVLDYVHNNEADRDYWPAWGVLPTGRLNVFDWSAFAWHYDCAQRTGGACDRWVSELFPPLIWYFDFAADLARSLRHRGPLHVVAEAARCAFTVNVKSAYEAGVLGTAIGDAAANALAGAAALGMAQAHLPDSDADEVGSWMIRAGALVGAVPSGVTQIAGAIIGCVGAAVQLFNQLFARARPVQRDLDAWGRDRPVFEQTYITGGATRADPPTHTAAEPPGWSRPLSFPTLVYIPTMEVIEAAKADGAHRHPAARPARGVPGAVLAMGLVAILGIVALATRDRWADDVRGG